MNHTYIRGDRVGITNKRSAYHSWTGIVVDRIDETHEDYDENIDIIVQFDAKFFDGNINDARENTDMFNESELKFIEFGSFDSISEAINFILDE